MSKKIYIYDKKLGRMVEKPPEKPKEVNIGIKIAEHPFGPEWKK